MNFKVTLASLTTFLNKVTKLIFGPDTPFVGDVYNNVSSIVNMLGEDGLLVLVSVIIILSYLKKD